MGQQQNQLWGAPLSTIGSHPKLLHVGIFPSILVDDFFIIRWMGQRNPAVGNHEVTVGSTVKKMGLVFWDEPSTITNCCKSTSSGKPTIYTINYYTIYQL